MPLFRPVPNPRCQIIELGSDNRECTVIPQIITLHDVVVHYLPHACAARVKWFPWARICTAVLGNLATSMTCMSAHARVSNTEFVLNLLVCMPSQRLPFIAWRLAVARFPKTAVCIIMRICTSHVPKLCVHQWNPNATFSGWLTPSSTPWGLFLHLRTS